MKKYIFLIMILLSLSFVNAVCNDTLYSYTTTTTTGYALKATRMYSGGKFVINGNVSRQITSISMVFDPSGDTGYLTAGVLNGTLNNDSYLLSTPDIWVGTSEDRLDVSTYGAGNVWLTYNFNIPLVVNPNDVLFAVGNYSSMGASELDILGGGTGDDDIAFGNDGVNWATADNYRIALIVYGCDYVPATALNFTKPTPQDNAHNSTYTGVIINATTTETGLALYWNGTLIGNGSETSPFYFELNSSLVQTEGNYTYWAYDGTNNISRTWTYDVSAPSIVINQDNFFNEDNSSELTSILYEALISFNISDEGGLFAYSINISKDGISYYNLTNNSITGTTLSVIQNVTDIYNFSNGIFNVEILASDTHTAKEIKNYDIKKSKNKLEFDTTEGNNIILQTRKGANLNTIKKLDRYEFEFDYDSSGSDTIDIYCDGTLYIPENSIYQGHLICSNDGVNGNWIDFEGVNYKPILTKINDNHYTAYFNYLPKTAKFNSIGGLNVERRSFEFELNRFGLDNCSLFNVPIINYSFIRLSDNLPVSVNISALMNYGTETNKIYNFSNQVYERTSIQYCMYPNNSNIYVDLSLSYTLGERIFSFYSTNTKLNNTLQQQTIYIDTGTQVIATVYDNSNAVVEGVYIYVQKFDLATNSYLLTTVEKTNFQGQAPLYLTKNTIPYRFMLYYPQDVLKKSTNPSYITSDSIQFQISLFEEPTVDYYNIHNTDYALTFNNDSKNFKFIYNDVSANIQGAKLEVYKGDTLYNSSIISGNSGTILVGIVAENGTDWISKAYLLYEGDYTFIDSLTVSFPSSDSLGDIGLFLLILLIIPFAFIYSYSLPLGVIVTPIPIIIFSILDLIELDIYIALGLEIMAIIIAIILGKDS